MAQYGALGKKQIIILRALCYLSGEQLRAVLRTADITLVRCICECALNVLRGNVILSTCQKRRLKRHTTLVRRLADKRGNWSSKRRLIAKRCSIFLKALVTPVLEHIKQNGAC